MYGDRNKKIENCVHDGQCLSKNVKRIVTLWFAVLFILSTMFHQSDTVFAGN